VDVPPIGATVVRVAVDLLGGDSAPDAVVAGVVVALRRDSRLAISLVGPPGVCRAGLTDAGDVAERVIVVPAGQVVDMGEDSVFGVRGKSDATVRLATDLLSDGIADAMVSIGSTGATVASSIFGLGLFPGLTRPALAVTLPAATGRVVLLDVGANVVPAAPILAQHALVGAAYAQGRSAPAQPRVGLLTIGAEAGKGDGVRRASSALLRRLPIHFVGNVEGDDVLRGGVADVVVTDGFTGNVLLKGMEGTYALLAGLLAENLHGDSGQLRAAFEQATAHVHPDRVAGAILLGVEGVVVVGHGASSPAAVAACIGQAAAAVRQGVLPALRATLAGLVSRPATTLTETTP